MQVSTNHSFCKILPVSVLGTEILLLSGSDMIFFFFSGPSYAFFVPGQESIVQCHEQYNGQWEMVKGRVKLMHTADTKRKCFYLWKFAGR